MNAKAPSRGWKARFPEAEKQLHDEFLKMRSEGKAVKRRLVSSREGQLITGEFKFPE